jgi:hypothetical protein
MPDHVRNFNPYLNYSTDEQGYVQVFDVIIFMGFSASAFVTMQRHRSAIVFWGLGGQDIWLL